MFTEAGTILEQAREYYENINHHLQKTTIIQKNHSKIRITLNAKKENLPIEESSSSLSFSHPAFLSSLWGIIYSIKFHQAFQETHGIWKTQRISMKNFKVLLVSEVTIWIFLFKHIQWYNNRNNLQESNLLKKKNTHESTRKLLSFISAVGDPVRSPSSLSAFAYQSGMQRSLPGTLCS